MNIRATINELSRTMGPPKHRAAHGSWVEPAWAVRGLVEQHGQGVTAAVKHVLEKTGHANNPQAFGSLRAAFYKCRDKEWPAEAQDDDTSFE